MEKMTVTRALAELKLLDSRINKEITYSSAFVDVSQKKTEDGNKALKSGMNKQEFEKRAESNYKSINDLIKRRNEIKSAILKSNAETKVKIGKNDYTVVEAIDQKGAINYKKSLLNSMKSQLSIMLSEIERAKGKVESQVETMLTQNLGGNEKTNENDYDIIAKPFIEANELKLIDPLKLQEKIDVLDKEIDEFESEVDFVLSESNSRTEIEF
jgi:hypothetical protein